LNIIEDPRIHIFLQKLAYIQTETHVDAAPAIVRAAFHVILVAASEISHMELQISQIRILDEVEPIGFEGY
jgi:hypothetical protein